MLILTVFSFLSETQTTCPRPCVSMLNTQPCPYFFLLLFAYRRLLLLLLVRLLTKDYLSIATKHFASTHQLVLSDLCQRLYTLSLCLPARHHLPAALVPLPRGDRLSAVPVLDSPGGQMPVTRPLVLSLAWHGGRGNPFPHARAIRRTCLPHHRGQQRRPRFPSEYSGVLAARDMCTAGCCLLRIGHSFSTG